jgi:Na+-transporting NADH:ubiquinone oxidoreductase subunit D
MKLTKTKTFKAFTEPFVKANPIAVAVLGICSALAVTTQIQASIVMALAMTFVLAFSNVIVSLLRHIMPKNIRIIIKCSAMLDAFLPL